MATVVPLPCVAVRTLVVLMERRDELAVRTFRADVVAYASLLWALGEPVKVGVATGDGPPPAALCSTLDELQAQLSVCLNAPRAAAPPLGTLLRATVATLSMPAAAHQALRVKLLLSGVPPTPGAVLADVRQVRSAGAMVLVDVLGPPGTLSSSQREGLVRVSVAPGRLVECLADARCQPQAVMRVPLRLGPGVSLEAAARLVVTDCVTALSPLHFRGAYTGGPLWPRYSAAYAVLPGADDAPARALAALLGRGGALLLGAADGPATHLLQAHGAGLALRVLEGDDEGAEQAAPLLCVNYAHAPPVAELLALLVPVVVARQVPLLPDVRARVEAAARALEALAARDDPACWRQLADAPLARVEAWSTLLSELRRAALQCSALAPLAPQLGRAPPPQRQPLLREALEALRRPTPGVGRGRLYPGLEDRPPRFGGGDGE